MLNACKAVIVLSQFNELDLILFAPSEGWKLLNRSQYVWFIFERNQGFCSSLLIKTELIQSFWLETNFSLCCVCVCVLFFYFKFHLRTCWHKDFSTVEILNSCSLSSLCSVTGFGCIFNYYYYYLISVQYWWSQRIKTKLLLRLGFFFGRGGVFMHKVVHWGFNTSPTALFIYW